MYKKKKKRHTFLFFNKIPSPKSSIPQLLLTIVKSFTSLLFKEEIKFSGIPQRPKPPTNNLDPEGISFTASSAEETTFEENVELFLNGAFDDEEREKKQEEGLATK